MLGDNKTTDTWREAMMTRSRFFILGLSCLLLLLCLFYIARPKSRLLLTLLPPADLYTDLTPKYLNVNLSSQGEIINLPIQHKYVGTYCAGLYTRSIPEIDVPLVSTAKLKLQVKQGNGVVYTQDIIKLADRFGTPGKTQTGVVLCCYKVPTNVPLNQHLSVTLSIQELDHTFEKKYGPLEFFINRKTDE
jgi:hypothetical protein